ncbi:MAG: ATP-grasp fold amidoligase family protein [Bacteroidota bacterium]
MKNPKTFNEKMLYSRRFVREYPIPEFADKLLVRDYVSGKIGSKYLVPLIGVYNNSNEIRFDTLPEKFVLKTNHGSGWNIVCQNKSTLDIKHTKEQVDHWLKLNYYTEGREWQYKNIKPVILIEEFLTNINDTPITDNKLFCFNGIPKFIQVDLDRFTNHRRQFYDLDWNLQEFTTMFTWEPRPVPKPKNLYEMIDIARKLSVGFKFLRVDLYNNGENLYFGELTLHHGGGCEPFIPSKYDIQLGNLLSI